MKRKTLLPQVVLCTRGFTIEGGERGANCGPFVVIQERDIKLRRTSTQD